jgi:hypothetical protein
MYGKGTVGHSTRSGTDLWFPRRFDPSRALSVPRSVGALIGTDPRVIADDVWAKLLWAGLNIEAADLPGTSAGSYYPMELIRALTLTWLFSGLRSDEISRLRVGCVRWQHDGCPFQVTPARSWPRTPSACSTYRRTRPAPHSPSLSTRASARPHWTPSSAGSQTCPPGATHLQLGASPAPTLMPIIDVRQGKPG